MSEAASDPGDGVVGVIGGMGPEATVEFLRRLVAATPARVDADHFHVLVDSNPKIPSRMAALIEGTGDDPTPALQAMARGLAAAGADLIAMPCNTAHHFLPAIQDAVMVPVLDMIALSVADLAALAGKPRRVGMLASPAVRMVKLFDAPLRAAGLQALFPTPEDEAALRDVIEAVKAGDVGAGVRRDYARVAAALAGAGAQCLLIACTELSVLGAPDGTRLPVVDTLDVLVHATIAAARATGVP